MRLPRIASIEVPHRVLLLEPFPIPYFASLHRALAARDDIEIVVAFANMSTTDASFRDVGFARNLSWDVPLLEGYEWVDLSKLRLRAKARLITNSDVVFLSTYRTPHALLAWLLAIASRRPVLFGSDAIDLLPQGNSVVRGIRLRRALARGTIRLADGVNATSTRSVEYHRRFTRHSEKIALVPYVADGDVFVEQSASDRAAAREAFGLSPSAFVVGFVGKLIPRKRAEDVIHAVTKVRGATALIVGSGPSEPDLRALASRLGASVVFAGFKNQTELPQSYAAMDVAVLPSEQEPFGIVVHEAALCGVVPACSTACGAYDDLVAPVASWLGFTPGDLQALVDLLRALHNDNVRFDLRERARVVAAAWNVDAQAQGFVDACARAIGRK